MSQLPVSVLLATWLDAVRDGRVGPDELADAVRGDDPRHLVVDLPERAVLELVELPAALHGPLSLALPAPGDLLGLGGPPALNAAALDAGQAVLAGAVALVPEVDARTVVWRAHRADPAAYVDARETASELRTVLLTVTQRLVELDVASWQPEIPDLLTNLRHRAPLPLPPGTDPRVVEAVERAVLCLEVVELARADEAGRSALTRCTSAAPPWATSTAPPDGRWWGPAPAGRADPGRPGLTRHGPPGPLPSCPCWTRRRPPPRASPPARC